MKEIIPDELKVTLKNLGYDTFLHFSHTIFLRESQDQNVVLGYFWERVYGSYAL